MSGKLSNGKTIAINTILLYVRMMFVMFVGLYTSRVILDKLGENDFGIYNVVGGFVSMFAVISGAMTTASQRFISFEIGKNDNGDVKSIFGTIVYIHIFLSLLVVILGEFFGVWFLNTQMSIPMERVHAATLVFHISLLTFSVNVLCIPYNAAIIAYEKMSAFAYIGIIQALLNLVICYLISITQVDRLIMYAILLAIVQLLATLSYYFYCRIYIKQCRFNGRFNSTCLKTIFSFVSWNLIGSIASIAKGQGINVLLNIFFGPAVNAARGIAYNVLNKVNGFVTNFQIAMNPQIIKTYAAGERDSMYSLVFRGAKISYILLLLLSLPLIIEAPLILNLWLKRVPNYTIVFLRLALLTALLESVSNPLKVSMHASGKVRDYQIVVGGLSLLTLPAVYFVLKQGVEPYYAMIISFIVEAVCHVARLFMLKRSIGFPMLRFLKDVSFRVFIISIVAFILPCIEYLRVPNEIARFFIVVISSTISVLLFGYYLGFSKEDRNLIWGKVVSIVRKRFLRNG